MTSVLVYVLAVWRLAHMLVKEDGPGDIILWLRTEIEEMVSAGQGGGALEAVFAALSCVSCTSVWAAGLLLFVPWQVRLLLAGSAVAKIIEDYFYESAGEVIGPPEDGRYGPVFSTQDPLRQSLGR